MTLGGLNDPVADARTKKQMGAYKANYAKYSNVRRGAFMVVLVSIFSVIAGFGLKTTVANVTEIAVHMGGVCGEMSDALDEFSFAMKPVQEMLEITARRRRLTGENPNRRLVAQSEIDDYAAELSAYASDANGGDLAQAQAYVNQGMDMGLSMDQLQSTLSPLVAERVASTATSLFASFCATMDRNLGFSINTGNPLETLQDAVVSAKY